MKYHCIKQHDITDCGAACLATICRQNGYKTSISRIREVAGTDKQGTNVAGGAVALVVGGTAVSPLLAAGYAGATYFYGRNREN